MFMVTLETPRLGPQASEREVYVQFIYLSTYTSIASKGKPRGNEYLKKD